MEAVVDGVTYVSQTAIREQSCKGCAASRCDREMSDEERDKARALCFALPECAKDSGIIFVRKLEAISTSEALPLRGAGAQYDAGYKAGYAAAVAQHNWPHAVASVNVALARKTDPTTSHKAAEAMTRKAGKIADLILVELGSGGLRPPTYGLTGKQLAQRTGVPLNSITPRFAQLVRKGLIYAYSGAGRETVWALGNGVSA